MDTKEIYTKSDVGDFMARQGLVYSGLDEHYDKWINEYYSQWFECIGEDKYILSEDY